MLSLFLYGLLTNEVGKIWREAEPGLVADNQQSRFTTDLPLAPEFRDAVTRHLVSTSPLQPIKLARHGERRLNSRTNSRLSSFIPASRAASPSSKALAAMSCTVWPTRQEKKDSCTCTFTYYLPFSTSAGIPTGREVRIQSASPPDATSHVRIAAGRGGILALHRRSTSRFIYILGRSTFNLMS